MGDTDMEMATAAKTDAGKGGRRVGRVYRLITQTSIIGILITLIVECVILSFLSPYFLSPRNFLNVMRSISLTGIVAGGGVVGPKDTISMSASAGQVAGEMATMP